MPKLKLLSPVFPPRRPSGVVRYILAATIVLLLFYVFHSRDDPARPRAKHAKAPPRVNPHAHPYNSDVPLVDSRPGHNEPKKPKPHVLESAIIDENFDDHPISKLIHDAQHTFADLLSEQTTTVEQAAQAYRKRRGRHPPPGFDLWFEFAQQNDAIIVEDFFDQVYHDLEPFWGVDPPSLRIDAWRYEMTVNIRDGNASTTSDWFWTVIWKDLIDSIVHLLPDMDIPLNAMDEPRIVVPWEDMEQYMTNAAKTRHLPRAKNVRGDFQKLPDPKKTKHEMLSGTKFMAFEDTMPYWKVVRRGCAPDSPARTAELQESFDHPPHINMTAAEPHLFQGYVSNFSLSTDLCHQPDLQGLQGIFIEPLSVSTSKLMFPMFAGSKLGVNNDVLLPAPMYWNEDERFTGGDERGLPWDEKKDEVIWRGVATGGRNRATNWKGFQRHRFVAMNNQTTLNAIEYENHVPENFALPEPQYEVQAQGDGNLGDWVGSFADVGFVDLMCEPSQDDLLCPHTNHYFNLQEGVTMSDQFSYKILPDIDGNSFSGRYLGFLRSSSLPIKATVFHEWHDSRLVPWKHFVPMDNRFGDYFGIIEYFLGYAGQGDHDKAAEKIASDGKEWAELVLRKEDMQIYTLRLLLEFARLLDDEREHMGWVDDVLADPTLETNWSWWW